jgi:hypothetical protein
MCILAISNNVMGCSYFSSEHWIRSICSPTLFSAGPKVFNKGNVIIEHECDIVGLVKNNGCIISIGLDYCFKIHSDVPSIKQDEENEIIAYLMNI